MFRRVVEDFTCTHCGKLVVGDGYTNHCPHCLYSKHVDTSPGDRAADCGGSMAPVEARVDTNGDRKRLVHRCSICGHEKVNDLEDTDNTELFWQIYQEARDKETKG